MRPYGAYMAQDFAVRTDVEIDRKSLRIRVHFCPLRVFSCSMASRPGLLDVSHRGERYTDRSVPSTQATDADNSADASDSVMVAEPVVSPSGRLVGTLSPSGRRTSWMTAIRSRPQATESEGEAITSAQQMLLTRMDTLEFKVVKPLGDQVAGLQSEMK